MLSNGDCENGFTPKPSLLLAGADASIKKHPMTKAIAHSETKP